MKILKIECAAFFAFIICITVSTYNLNRSCDGIRQGVLRLHVIAASDSDYDQQIKLMLRDEMLKKGKEIFSGSETKKQAEEKINNGISVLQKTAESFLKSKNYPYDVSVGIENCYFPTRKYDSFVLPAGYYDALRVVIGEGKGQNWWCVMFPALCLPAAKDCKNDFDGILTSEQISIISEEKYEIRLWLVEKWQEIRRKIVSENKNNN